MRVLFPSMTGLTVWIQEVQREEKKEKKNSSCSRAPENDAASETRLKNVDPCKRINIFNYRLYFRGRSLG